MNKSAFVVMLFFLIASTVHAVDDQAVLQVKIREALQYEQRGNSQEAERLYKQLLEDFQHNRQIIKRLVYLYLRTNNLDKLEKLLENERDYLSQNYYEITQIELFIKKNELDKARSLADSMLTDAGVNAVMTRQVAQLYQRYNLFADAAELYLRARNESNNPILFAQELASVYQAMGRPLDALDEYLHILDERTYKNVRYFIEKLDLTNEETLEALQKRLQAEPRIELQELIGEFYVLSKQYQKAFSLYKTLGKDTLIKLATVAEKQQLYELSIQCLEEVLNTTEDIQTILYLENKIGELYYLNNEHEHAYDHYKNVIDLFQNTNATLPSTLIFEAYKNLALIELFENKNPVKSQQFLEKTLHYAGNKNEKANLSIMLSQSYLQQEDYVNSEKLLDEILLNKHISQDMKDMAKMQLIQTVLLKGDFAEADTLAKTFLTHDYESVYVNNVAELYRTINNELHLTQADDSVKNATSSLLKNMYFNNSNAVMNDFEQLSIALRDSATVSYIMLQIADHYYDQGAYADASKLYSELLKDEQSPYIEYIYIKIADCMNQLGLDEKAQIYYTEYLLAFPQGTFAPEIRCIIKK